MMQVLNIHYEIVSSAKLGLVAIQSFPSKISGQMDVEKTVVRPEEATVAVAYVAIRLLRHRMNR
jgi:hypothetical protein